MAMPVGPPSEDNPMMPDPQADAATDAEASTSKAPREAPRNTGREGGRDGERGQLPPLDPMLAPRSVAVVGASSDPARIGGRPIATMLAAGFQGRIMPVNPARDRIQGLPCHASVADLPEAPDAAIVAVPAAQAPDVVEALGERGCRSVILFSSGFAETGPEGRAAQERILASVRRHGMRLLGPNTLGLYNAAAGWFGTFSSSIENALPLPGRIGIASQSGAFGAHVAAVARRRGIGAPVLITTGNEADVTAADAIGWMARDPGTDVICAYLEAFSDPPGMVAALEAARQAGKPVFVLKAGRSRIGASAAASHTASLSGDDAVASAVLAEHGAIRVHDIETMLDLAYAAQPRIYPVPNSLGVITISGGAGIVAADEAEALDLPLPPMPADAQARLKALLPFASPVNPLDCTAQALNDLSLFDSYTRTALADGGYPSVLCFLTYVTASAAIAPRLVGLLSAIRADFPDRLLVLCSVADDETNRRYEETGFLVFSDPGRAVRAIAAMGRVGRALAARPAAAPPLPDFALPADTPDEHATKELLVEAGLPAPPERLVGSPAEAAEAAAALGFPVVVKIASPDILHKTDIGGVRLNLGDADAVRDAAEGILASVARAAPDARISGLLVARQITDGVECLMGISRDPGFGPVALFGLGGIFAETLKDVVIRPCPFDEGVAREMILSIRAAPILTGARGRPPVDLDALAAMLSRLSAVSVAAGPRLRALDLNPVIATPEGAWMLDAAIEIDPPAPA